MKRTIFETKVWQFAYDKFNGKIMSDAETRELIELCRNDELFSLKKDLVDMVVEIKRSMGVFSVALLVEDLDVIIAKIDKLLSE